MTDLILILVLLAILVPAGRLQRLLQWLPRFG